MNNTVLEHPVLRQQVLPMPVHTFQLMGEMGLVEEGTELIRGFVLPNVPPSPLHRIVCQRLIELLRKYVPPGFTVWQEQPITCADSEPEPDIAVVQGGVEDFAHAHPTTAALVVEVAVSSLARDQEKTMIYADAGVGEYWLVNPEGGWIEQFSGLNTLVGGYAHLRKLGAGETIVSTAFPQISIPVSQLLA